MSYPIYNIESKSPEAIPPILPINKKPRINRDKENFQDILDLSIRDRELKEKVAMRKLSARDDDEMEGSSLEDFEVIEDLGLEEEDAPEESASGPAGKRQKGYKFENDFERRDPIMPEINDMALFAYIPEDAMVYGYDIEDIVDSIGEDDSLDQIRTKAKDALGLTPISDVDKRVIIDGIKILYGDQKKSERDKSIAQVEDLNELEAASILDYIKGKTPTIINQKEKKKSKTITQLENLEEDKNE